MTAMALGAYQTNCYIAWGENAQGCVVIDPGYQPERVLEKVQSLGKTIDAILLTHGHFDHVGGVRELAAETGCRVYISRQDLSLPPQLTAGKLFCTHTYGKTVEEGGLVLQVLETPGHTPGSVCLLTGDTIFSGDTLFEGSCGRTDLPGGSWETIAASLSTIAALPGDYAVYPGHGPATTLEEERMYNPYMR